LKAPGFQCQSPGQVNQAALEPTSAVDASEVAEESTPEQAHEDMETAVAELPETAMAADPEVPEESAPVSAEQETAGLPGDLPAAEEKPPEKKNIILIYAESLETLYFDQEIFGDLVPNIRVLSESAHNFTNLVQVRGTGWTIAGIVASQCGFPINVSNHLASNSTIASVDKPYADQTCLADILSENGYQTTYMGGAPLWFAGKDKFLRTHGYKTILGYEALVPRLENDNYKSGWGVYDDSLFDLALEELQSLEKGVQPYFLTLLTLDTHHPRGIPSSSCRKLADDNNSMSNAIFCSDQLISEFIKEAMSVVDMDETIIVLFSDHLSLRNALWHKLQENRKQRRLLFLIFDNKPITVSDRRATHFDVAPTILEAAGFTGPLNIGVGTSLFSPASTDAGKLKPGQLAENTPSLLDPEASVKKHGIELLRQDFALRVGDLTLKANDSGDEFVSGMYLAVLDDRGVVVDVIYSGNYRELAKNLSGQFVVGLSLLPDPPYSAVYFFGTISPDGKGITQRRFNHDVKLSPDDIWGPEG
jgi:phosphoglycerol transferase